MDGETLDFIEPFESGWHGDLDMKRNRPQAVAGGSAGTLEGNPRPGEKGPVIVSLPRKLTGAARRLKRTEPT
jgi:hypothetical protein